VYVLTPLLGIVFLLFCFFFFWCRFGGCFGLKTKTIVVVLNFILVA